ncbi:MAG: alpha/beta fold hydrolase [Selenomonadaceae bacterium]|nr:alpha/beta fold hydrolase [Selenomonadaceae bacterium]
MKKIFLTAFLSANLIFTPTFAMKSVTIQNQGSFFAGGTVVTADGVYNAENPKDFSGHTLHGDHAYVFYQIPVKAKKYSLVFLHGSGQSGKTWETTPDGRDGFQNIFLERGYKTFIVDQPRRGRAGRSTVSENISARPDDQLWYYNFRIGIYPEVYDGVEFPRDEESLNQFLRQMTPNTGAFNSQIVADSMVEVMEKAGEGILITHSAGGGPGWITAVKSDKVKAIISLEPGTFPFPEGEVPEVEETSSPFPARGQSVSMEDFLKLTKIPIVVYFGDNIPTGEKISDNWGFDNWRIRLNLAKKWEQVMKKYGGDVEIVYLPDVGIRGNTHFLMSDKNNLEIANVMEKWLKSKGLTK